MAQKAVAHEELVEIFIPKGIDARERGDVFACVNGKRYQVKRGFRVKVPVSVKEVIEASMRQDAETGDMIASLTESASAQIG